MGFIAFGKFPELMLIRMWGNVITVSCEGRCNYIMVQLVLKIRVSYRSVTDQEQAIFKR